MTVDYREIPMETLAVMAKAGDRLAANQVMKASGWLIGKHTRQYASYMNPQDVVELQQAAYMGLMRAYEKFEPARGFKFTTYASWWVRKFVQSAAWKDKKSRMASLDAMVGEDSDVRMVDMLADPKSEDGFNEINSAEDKTASKAVLKLLTPKEARVMELRFGIEAVKAPDDDVMARVRAIEAKARRAEVVA